MADGKEKVSSSDLANMAAAALGAGYMHLELPSSLKERLTPTDMLSVASVVVGQAIRQAKGWPEGDPRIAVWQEVTSHLGAALVRPQGDH